jgi:uncharacterized damage-inducible protein DinB
MDAPEYLRRQLGRARTLYDDILRDITEEQFNWSPPGTANPIRAVLVHMLTTEDQIVQRALLGRPTLWQSAGWGELLGHSFQLNQPFLPEEAWAELKERALDLGTVRDYGRTVHAATDGYFARLTPDELDREVPFVRGKAPVVDALTILLAHAFHHGGEIAALRGVQGAKGLSF